MSKNAIRKVEMLSSDEFQAQFFDRKPIRLRFKKPNTTDAPKGIHREKYKYPKKIEKS